MAERSYVPDARSRRRGLVAGTLLAAVAALLSSAAPAGARATDEVLTQSASYPGLTTYSCRTNAIPIYPGQNLNLFGLTKTCPNAEKVSGPGDVSPFAPGSTAEGYVTRFKPSMVEVKPDGSLTTPSVWDLHLHHVVWLAPGSAGGGPTFGTGRGEDDRQAARRATGSRSAATRPGASTT